jgi:hypothetical protein
VHRISNRLQRFIFDHIDSVSFLETLLLLYTEPAREWTVENASREMRGNVNSTEKCFTLLKRLHLAKEVAPGTFVFGGDNPDLVETVAELSEAYKVQRHRILEAIFSPMKRARDFAEAFTRSQGEEE